MVGGGGAWQGGGGVCAELLAGEEPAGPQRGLWQQNPWENLSFYFLLDRRETEVKAGAGLSPGRQ
jgi:hypothetical protein